MSPSQRATPRGRARRGRPLRGGLVVAVELLEDLVALGVVAGEVDAGAVGVLAAEDEAPAPEPLVVDGRPLTASTPRIARREGRRGAARSGSSRVVVDSARIGDAARPVEARTVSPIIRRSGRGEGAERAAEEREEVVEQLGRRRRARRR